MGCRTSMIKSKKYEKESKVSEKEKDREGVDRGKGAG